MEKKIEDYLHLYLGCDAEINEGKIKVTCNNGKREVKLILRPLSDMTEEERKELWDIVFQKRFISEFKGNTVFINKDNNGIPRWVLSSGVERLGIQFDGRIWADSDLHVWDHNQYEITRWLLNKGFDLFGLIESGLAIDKTTLK